MKMNVEKIVELMQKKRWGKHVFNWNDQGIS